MPTPIQSSSITAKLRSFFRLRGRQIFTLDETSVPVVQVEDLTDAPYREGHQVRWMVGALFQPDVVALRNFLIIVNTASLGVITLARVPGVAVIERMTIRQDSITPNDAQRWDVELTSHAGLIGQFEVPTMITARASNVDSPSNPTGTNIVQGQVPIQLIGAAEAAVPVFGTQLVLGQANPNNGEDVYDVLLGAHVVIGDNVALTLTNRSVATAGIVWVNVVGSYYPLARS
jgi:hypothetical protein